MKNECKRTLRISAVFAVILIITSSGVFADSSGSTDKIREDTEKVKDDSAKVLKSIGEAVKDTGNALGEKVSAAISQDCLGTWIYTNADCETSIMCNVTGMMRIRQKKGDDVTYWRGSFSSTSDQITFHVTSTGTGNFPTGKSSEMDEIWILHYRIENDAMQIRSKNIPKDKNGHSFSGKTIFVRH